MSWIGEQLLRGFCRRPDESDYRNEQYELRHSDLQVCLGNLVATFPDICQDIAGRRVLNIGCAEGLEAIALSALGAEKVLAVDLRMDLSKAQRLKAKHRPEAKIEFQVMDATTLGFSDCSFDAAVTLGSLEHFTDPELVLRQLKRVVRDDGCIYLTSGHWSGPWGAHMQFFTRVPWLQYLFSERTIMAVRSRYRSDGARKFAEVEGGLNRITLRSFREIARRLDLKIERLECSPVKSRSILLKIPLLSRFFVHTFRAMLRK